jgi:dTDP-4-dehydrorhamnose reductase
MILVFGRTGQVARELGMAAPQALFLGREEADLSDPAACAAAIYHHAPNAVINAAAYTAVDRAEEEEALATVINGEAPAAMAQVCAEFGIPFVHISTDYVFDGSGTASFAPEDPAAPLGAYGRSKLQGELGARAANGAHAILRTSWVFSAHGTNFVKTMLRLGAEREKLTVVADQIGGPTSARAIAHACLIITEQLQADPGKSGTYHFAGQPETSWAGFARAIMTEAGLKCRIEGISSAEYSIPAQRPLNSRLDCRSLSAFNLAQPDWRADLQDVIEELEASR